MQFRAVIPPGVRPGEVVRVSAQGAQLRVRVPARARPGDPMVFEVGPTVLAAASGGGDGAPILEAALGPPIADRVDASGRGRSATDGGTRFRRLLAPWFCNEFGMALGMAVLIALSIVCGFIMGILYVTRPLGPHGQVPPTTVPRNSDGDIHSFITKSQQDGRTVLQLHGMPADQNRW